MTIGLNCLSDYLKKKNKLELMDCLRFKAKCNTNIDIPLDTAAIFFSIEPLSKN